MPQRAFPLMANEANASSGEQQWHIHWLGAKPWRPLPFERVGSIEELDARLRDTGGRYVMLDVYADRYVSCKECFTSPIPLCAQSRKTRCCCTRM